jgi:hypothetical protein
MIRKSKTISKKVISNPVIVEEVKEEVVPEDVSISEIIAETIPDTVVLEEKATIIEEEKPNNTKDLEEIKRLREKLNNGTISDGEATMLFELLKD